MKSSVSFSARGEINEGCTGKQNVKKHPIIEIERVKAAYVKALLVSILSLLLHPRIEDMLTTPSLAVIFLSSLLFTPYMLSPETYGISSKIAISIAW